MRSTTAGGTYSLVGMSYGNTFSNTGLTAGTTYLLRRRELQRHVLGQVFHGERDDRRRQHTASSAQCTHGPHGNGERQSSQLELDRVDRGRGLSLQYSARDPGQPGHHRRRGRDRRGQRVGDDLHRRVAAERRRADVRNCGRRRLPVARGPRTRSSSRAPRRSPSRRPTTSRSFSRGRPRREPRPTMSSAEPRAVRKRSSRPSLRMDRRSLRRTARSPRARRITTSSRPWARAGAERPSAPIRSVRRRLRCHSRRSGR